MSRIPDLDEFYYNNRYCPECGGHQKNCEHFWAGHIVGKQFGIMLENERIIKLLEDLLEKDNPNHDHYGLVNLEEVIDIIKKKTNAVS